MKGTGIRTILAMLKARKEHQGPMSFTKSVNKFAPVQ